MKSKETGKSFNGIFWKKIWFFGDFFVFIYREDSVIFLIELVLFSTKISHGGTKGGLTSL